MYRKTVWPQHRPGSGIRVWRCVSPPNWLSRGISCCPRTFCPAKWILAGYLALPLDVLPRQTGFGGLSLRINSIPIQKRGCIKARRSHSGSDKASYSCCSLQRITQRLTNCIIRVTFVIPIILIDCQFLFRCRPAHPQSDFHSTHS